MDEHTKTRRQFCTHAISMAALGGALSSILQGCGSGNGLTSPSSINSLPIVSATDLNGGVVVTIDSSSPLASVGGAALVQSPSALVLVARTAQGSFTALSPVCTHQACTITGYANQTFVCPCHGSQFSSTGQVISGPAFAPLTQFHTQFVNNVLTITA